MCWHCSSFGEHLAFIDFTLIAQSSPTIFLQMNPEEEKVNKRLGYRIVSFFFFTQPWTWLCLITREGIALQNDLSCPPFMSLSSHRHGKWNRGGREDPIKALPLPLHQPEPKTCNVRGLRTWWEEAHDWYEALEADRWRQRWIILISWCPVFNKMLILSILVKP